MQTVIILLVILIPIVIAIVGIIKAKKKRIEERDEMFYDGDVKFGENADGVPVGIDAVAEISKILREELDKATKTNNTTHEFDKSKNDKRAKTIIANWEVKKETEASLVKTKRKKPAKKKKSEFGIEPIAAKPKSKRVTKPKNKDGGDQMLLS